MYELRLYDNTVIDRAPSLGILIDIIERKQDGPRETPRYPPRQGRPYYIYNSEGVILAKHHKRKWTFYDELH